MSSITCPRCCWHRQIGAAEPILPWLGVCGLCLGIQATQELSVPRREVVGEIPADFSKEDIYARLCRPIPFDGSTKVVWMEKSSGGICMSISTKELSITGIDDRRYWSPGCST
ncbi:hypothetical protein MRB53_005914 [Persea americana]|uniref:Uncharacterized protein n=1 Tax=Persea americana TaxID=3435 RepID=A0ACC2MFI5_PERAE|nr:hypothetical protein MRB53_005914 [Persea americana]